MIRPIPVPGAQQIVITADGRTADILGISGQEHTVTPISTATNTPGKTIKTGPWQDDVVITPDGTTAYDINTGQAVTPVSLATNTAGKPLNVNGFPLSIAITPDGKTAYAWSNNGSGQQVVTPISIATNTPGKPVTITAPEISIVIAGAQGAP